MLSGHIQPAPPFFTPPKTAKFMVKSLLDLDVLNNVKILDPGAGLGIFESAICDLLITQKAKVKIFFDLYENDKTILPFLNFNMDICKRRASENGIDLIYKINNKDFILSNSFFFDNESDNSIGRTISLSPLTTSRRKGHEASF